MRATGPAARPAHSFFKLCAHPLDVLLSRFRFLDGDDPADPFVARERCNILPFCSRRWVRSERLSQVRWHFVDHASDDSLFGHGCILADQSENHVVLRKYQSIFNQRRLGNRAFCLGLSASYQFNFHHSLPAGLTAADSVISFPPATPSSPDDSP